jgi:uncharacterized protein YfaS (alpha-2-macroglobulin family)
MRFRAGRGQVATALVAALTHKRLIGYQAPPWLSKKRFAPRRRVALSLLCSCPMDERKRSEGKPVASHWARRSSRKIFGRVAWEPPFWVVVVRRQSARAWQWAGRHRLLVLTVATAALMLGALAYRLYRADDSRPKPRAVRVTVVPPMVRDYHHAKAPRSPLLLMFDSPVAPMEKIGSRIDGMALDPPMAGHWRWVSDYALAFLPKRDWPVGAKMHVVVGKGVLSAWASLKHRRLPFSTPALTAKLDTIRFYEDPRDQTRRHVVATIRFSHPVMAQSLRERIKLAMGRKKTGNSKNAADLENLSFSLNMGPKRLLAHVKSEPLQIPRRDRPATLSLAAGVRATAGGRPSATKLSRETIVPGLYSHVAIRSARSVVVDSDDALPQHVLMVETNTAINRRVWASHLRACVLPRVHPDDKKRGKKNAYRWHDPARIGRDLLAVCKPLALTLVENQVQGVSEQSKTRFAFRYRAPVGRWLYLHIKRDLPSSSGYRLGKNFVATHQVPRFPAKLRFASKGEVLRLLGSRKLALYTRNVVGVRYRVWRVLKNQLHHFVRRRDRRSLASMTWGWLDRFSELFTVNQLVDVDAIECKNPQSEACRRGKMITFDLGAYLTRHEAGSGVFLVEAQSVEDAGFRRLGSVVARRVVVVTDLGLIVKRSGDQSRDIFVASLSAGRPLAGVRVALLGRNGLPILTRRSDGRGHVRLAPLTKAQTARHPQLIVAQRGRDTAFIAWSNWRNELSFSRFRTGGISGADDPKRLRALLFSDRGLYRPGEAARLAAIIKRGDLGGDLRRIPFEIEVSDPRGTVVMRELLELDQSGMGELVFKTERSSMSGRYDVRVYIARSKERSRSIGSTSINVREFAADRLKIRSRISLSSKGWLLPQKGLSGCVSLRTLYGTAAAGHRLSGTLRISTAYPHFRAWPGYSFSAPTKNNRSFRENIGEKKSDRQGRACFPLALERLDGGIYWLHFTAEGYEKAGGRSVISSAAALFSPHRKLIGYKADGALNLIAKDSARRVTLLAIDHQTRSIRQPNLTLSLHEKKYVSVLTKQYDGTYAYQSVAREVLLSTKPLTIEDGGTALALDTATAGGFALVVRNLQGVRLARIEYSVAGERNVARSLEKSTTLEVSTAGGDVEAGKLLRLEIKGPYAGSGLITIERDRVYAHRWFRARKGTKVTSIRVPRGLEGNAYLVVTLARDPRSTKIYRSPLSYAVKPFSISKKKRTLALQLDVPEKVEAGSELVVRYRGSRRGRVALYAVNEGILRVAGYRTPDPLAFFFAKRALSVSTFLTLKKVLPDAKLVVSAPGGGDGSGLSRANLNPFRRRRITPVAFWAGIRDIGPKARTWRVRLPDHFDGTVRVMAVAASGKTLGAATTEAVAKGELVLTTGAPPFVAPGDRFRFAVAVSNQKKGSGRTAKVQLSIGATEQLELLDGTTRTLVVPEQGEGVAHFRVRAKHRLGPATLRIVAKLGDARRKARVELSVRPASPKMTTVRAGTVKDGARELKVTRSLYAAFRQQYAGISALPLSLTPGLIGYLQNYPHGCTEQIVSGAMAALVLHGRGIDRPKTNAAAALSMAAARQKDPSTIVAGVIKELQRRQNSAGAFGMWTSSPKDAPLATVYSLHFLLEAKRRGITVPSALLDRGLSWVQRELSRDHATTLTEERLRAYMAYVLALSGRVVGADAAAIHRRLEGHKGYLKDIAPVYLAATYRLMRQDRLAAALIEKAVDFGRKTPPDYQNGLYDSLIHDAQLLLLLSRHFPKQAARVSEAGIDALVKAVRAGQFNTLSAAYTVLALDSYSQKAASLGEFAVDELGGLFGAKALTMSSAVIPQAVFSARAKALRFRAKGPFRGFYSVMQAGYDRNVPAKAIRSGLTVHRDYVDAAGKKVELSKLRLGQRLYARIRLRSTSKRSHRRIAIVDLLPGGFEIEHAAAVPREVYSKGLYRAGIEAKNFREDRALFYLMATPNTREVAYCLKAIAVGEFTTPPVKAESMYDRSLLGVSQAGKLLTVSPPGPSRNGPLTSGR